MSHYEGVIKREWKFSIESIADDIKARRDKDFFWPNGTQVYCGMQGQGKTISAVKHLLKLKQRYPKAIVVTNLKLNVPWTYIGFQSMDELAELLVKVNNGKYGVIYLIDEIHTYFNSLESKNIPMFVFTEISQQRKQRKLIIGTSQLFTRLAKPFREQCDNIIMCRTYLGVLTKQTAYDGMTLDEDYDGNITGEVRKRGFFIQTRKIRNAFDTFQKVVSAQEQYETVQRPLTFDKSAIKAFRKK